MIVLHTSNRNNDRDYNYDQNYEHRSELEYQDSDLSVHNFGKHRVIIIRLTLQNPERTRSIGVVVGMGVIEN